MRPLKLGGLVAASVILVGSACGTAPRQTTVRAALASAPAPRELTPEAATTTTTVATTVAPAPLRPASIAPPRRVVAPAQQTTIGSERCGGSLPPCWVMMRESRGNPRAINPTGCSGRGCYGKWQFDPLTWANTKGGYLASDGVVYARADQAPEWVQDERATQIWNGGRGCSNWGAC